MVLGAFKAVVRVRRMPPDDVAGLLLAAATGRASWDKRVRALHVMGAMMPLSSRLRAAIDRAAPDLQRLALAKPENSGRASFRGALRGLVSGWIAGAGGGDLPLLSSLLTRLGGAVPARGAAQANHPRSGAFRRACTAWRRLDSALVHLCARDATAADGGHEAGDGVPRGADTGWLARLVRSVEEGCSLLGSSAAGNYDVEVAASSSLGAEGGSGAGQGLAGAGQAADEDEAWESADEDEDGKDDAARRATEDGSAGHDTSPGAADRAAAERASAADMVELLGTAAVAAEPDGRASGMDAEAGGRASASAPPALPEDVADAAASDGEAAVREPLVDAVTELQRSALPSVEALLAQVEGFEASALSLGPGGEGARSAHEDWAAARLEGAVEAGEVVRRRVAAGRALRVWLSRCGSALAQAAAFGIVPREARRARR